MAKSAPPADTIAPMLEDVDREVRQETVKVIAEIGTQDSIPLLIKATNDNDADVHRILTALKLTFHEYDKAIYHQERALSLNPNSERWSSQPTTTASNTIHNTSSEIGCEP